MKLVDCICESFRWIEYGAAALIVLVLSLAMYVGLSEVFGPEDRYGFSDPVIYDWSTEEEFVAFLRDCGAYNRDTIRRELETYRYHHSFRRQFDHYLEDVWCVLSFAVVIVFIVQSFKYYRRLQLRERFQNWIDNSLYRAEGEEPK